MNMLKSIPVGKFRHPWKTISWRGYVGFFVFVFV